MHVLIKCIDITVMHISYGISCNSKETSQIIPKTVCKETLNSLLVTQNAYIYKNLQKDYYMLPNPYISLKSFSCLVVRFVHVASTAAIQLVFSDIFRCPS